MRTTPFAAFVDDLELLAASFAPRLPRAMRRLIGAAAGVAALAAVVPHPAGRLEEAPSPSASASPLADLPG